MERDIFIAVLLNHKCSFYKRFPPLWLTRLIVDVKSAAVMLSWDRKEALFILDGDSHFTYSAFMQIHTHLYSHINTDV